MGIATKLALITKTKQVSNENMAIAEEMLNNMLDIEDHDGVYNEVIDRVFPIQNVPSPTIISENTLEDMQLTDWAKGQGYTKGGKALFHQILSMPTTDISMLLKRQQNIQNASPEWSGTMTELAYLEKDILWIYTLPEKLNDVWPIPLLFPSLPLLKRINRSENILNLYHFYRIWLTPLLQLVIPIMSILGPWFYLRYRIGWKLTIVQYFKLISFVMQQSMVDADFYQKSTRMFTLMLYGFMFIYSIVQSIDISRMLFSVKKKLVSRIHNIKRFVDEAYELVNKWNPGIISKPILPSGMAGIYTIWLNGDLRKQIADLMSRFYELDVSLSCRKLMIQNDWSFVKYHEKQNTISKTKCYGMRNPILGDKQRKNPMCLAKNIIITGPNAAGKSTYVRSIGANILCSQTLGISCSKNMEIVPVFAILSYMRVRDIVGSRSLFETEVEQCSNIIKTATEIQKNNQNAVIFFDEPMHSTPPLEGESAAYAVLEHLGTLSNIRTIVTSHYHRLTKLPAEKWVNLSMDAIYNEKTDQYMFPYKIRQGPSFQSIAIELLKGTDKLPSSVVQNAIKFKSDICKPNTDES
jgi:hypothetical protein